MRKEVLLFIFLLHISYASVAQNIGIGTATPASKLHIKGTGSGTQIVLEENAGSILRISNEPSGTGPYIGTTTNNPLSLVTNNTAKLTISTSGNIGIGQPNPTSHLHFSNTLGNKIALWGTNPNHYGIGIQPFQMQFYTPANTDDFVFGVGNSSSLIETMRIKGNGNVGIGTNNPQTTLDVNGDVNIENRVLLNNLVGTAGQVLTSGGAGGATTWSNMAYGTSDRFLFVTSNLNSYNGIFVDTISFNTAYALSGAISYNSNGLFTVNKSGLYSIKGTFSSIIDGTASGTTYSAVYFYQTGTLTYLGNYSRQSVANGGSFTNAETFSADLQIYFSAGSTFFFYGVLSAGSLTTNTGFNASPVSINLISE
jgi:hypothetical protein